MSKTRKVALSVNVQINVGNFQHIALTSYQEESVEYETKEELQAFEDDLRTDLMNGIVRSMEKIPEQLGKGVAEAQEVQEAIASAIPEWLANGPVPNIANQAKKKHLQTVSKQKEIKDKKSDVLDVDENDGAGAVEEPAPQPAKVEESPAKVEEPPAKVEEPTDLDTLDLFEDDEPPVASEATKEIQQETTKIEEPSSKEDKPQEAEVSTQPETPSKEVTVGETEEDPFDLFNDEDDDDLFDLG